jgi:S-methylmethionine-dependent homocysteine/selenocysteine methylase
VRVDSRFNMKGRRWAVGASTTTRVTLRGVTPDNLQAVLALELVKRRWDGPLGVYTHSGRFVMPNWIFNDVISPEEYLAEARRWVRRGARLVGGCCRIGPEHIRLLRERLGESL